MNGLRNLLSIDKLVGHTSTQAKDKESVTIPALKLLNHTTWEMRIITADETGLIKQILIENKRIVDFLNGWLSSSNDGEHKVETTL